MGKLSFNPYGYSAVTNSKTVAEVIALLDSPHPNVIYATVQLLSNIATAYCREEVPHHVVREEMMDSLLNLITPNITVILKQNAIITSVI